MLNLDAAGKGFVLPQLNVSGFQNSPWETLPFWWTNEYVEGCGEVRGGVREKVGEELWSVCKMNEKYK